MTIEALRAKCAQMGDMPRGARNSIGDIKGVRVGHATIHTLTNKTGVTVVLPAPGNLFTDKVVGAHCVINGFGKTLGLMQLGELNTIETPIALTNTLNVGNVHDALVQYTLEQCAQEGKVVHSINPIVCECNDAGLNDIANRVVTREHVFAAIQSASSDFAQGCVGAGAGTVCHDLKGGIGTSSRLIHIGGQEFVLGILVQTNHGILTDLMVDGEKVGEQIARTPQVQATDKGSCIVIVGTDLPLSDRQLARVLRRAQVGLARMGSYIGHGSGEVVVGFTTANRTRHEDTAAFVTQTVLSEHLIDIAFRACAQCCEEAILQSLLHAVTTSTGSKTVCSLEEAVEDKHG